MIKKYSYICLLLTVLFTLSSFKNDEINLEGNWHFEIDRNDEGITGKWYNKKLSDVIKTSRLNGRISERR